MADRRYTSFKAKNATSERSPHSIKLAMVSCGLGNTARGFETSTARWFESLREHSGMDVRLFCGGRHPGGKQLINFPRNSFWTKPIHAVPFMSERERWEWTYGVEQVTFWLALNVDLLMWKPDVVWLKDFPLAHLVRATRDFYRLKYKIIFANGGLPDVNAYKELDFIQQIQKQAFDDALRAGIPEERMELLGNCPPMPPPDIDRIAARQHLGFDEEDWIVLCVAAWNKYHKRIDYLIDEVARIPDKKVKLVLCGTPEVDAKALQDQGKQMLGDRISWLTVAPEEVATIMIASDVLVLPSIEEHFGNVLLEAAMCGLPIVTHPHYGARFALEDQFWMTDLSEASSLTSRLHWLRNNKDAVARKIEQLKRTLAVRFDEKRQVEKFENMVRRVLSAEKQRSLLSAQK